MFFLLVFQVGDKNCEFVVFVAVFVVILVKIRILLLNYSLPSLQVCNSINLFLESSFFHVFL